MSTSAKNSNACQQKVTGKACSSSAPAPVEEPLCKKKGFFGWLKEKVHSKEELEAMEIEKREKAKGKTKEKQTACKR